VTWFLRRRRRKTDGIWNVDDASQEVVERAGGRSVLIPTYASVRSRVGSPWAWPLRDLNARRCRAASTEARPGLQIATTTVHARSMLVVCRSKSRIASPPPPPLKPSSSSSYFFAVAAPQPKTTSNAATEHRFDPPPSHGISDTVDAHPHSGWTLSTVRRDNNYTTPRAVYFVWHIVDERANQRLTSGGHWTGTHARWLCPNDWTPLLGCYTISRRQPAVNDCTTSATVIASSDSKSPSASTWTLQSCSKSKINSVFNTTRQAVEVVLQNSVFG